MLSIIYYVLYASFVTDQGILFFVVQTGNEKFTDRKDSFFRIWWGSEFCALPTFRITILGLSSATFLYPWKPRATTNHHRFLQMQVNLIPYLVGIIWSLLPSNYFLCLFFLEIIGEQITENCRFQEVILMDPEMETRLKCRISLKSTLNKGKMI